MKIIIKLVDIGTIGVASIVGLRVALKALGASTEAPFVTWLYYDITDPILEPFKGIFPSPTISNTGVADIPAVFGLVIFIGLGYLVSSSLEWLFKDLTFKKIFRIHNDKDL